MLSKSNGMMAYSLQFEWYSVICIEYQSDNPFVIVEKKYIMLFATWPKLIQSNELWNNKLGIL